MSCIDGKIESTQKQYKIFTIYSSLGHLIFFFLFGLQKQAKQAQKMEIPPSVIFFFSYVRPVYIYIYVCTVQQCNTSSSSF